MAGPSLSGGSGLDRGRVLKSRFELFTAISLALHAGVFAGVALKRAHSRAQTDTGVAGGAASTRPEAAVAGETFDVPDLEPASEEAAEGAEAAPIEIDGPATPPAEAAGPSVPARPTSRARGAPARPQTAAAPEPPPLYGAVGDRAAGDLVTSFTRLFPIGASYDPLWERVPVGFYAEGDVTFYLGDDGTLTRTTVSAAAAPAFRVAILQTTALMKHRLFTARGAATHLHMIVRVTDRLVNRGAFTIDAAGSFELRSGKHVSVTTVER